MRNILILLCAILIFPFISSARTLTVKPAAKPLANTAAPGRKTVTMPRGNGVFPNGFPADFAIGEGEGYCDLNCVLNAGLNESMQNVLARSLHPEASSGTVGRVLNRTPALKSKLGESMTPEEAEATGTALLAAALYSGKWDTDAQEEVINLINKVMDDGAEVHEKQLASIRDHCEYDPTAITSI